MADELLKTMLWRWTDDGVMAPVGRYASQKLLDATFTVGETYLLSPFEQRSKASHAHYFAQLADLFANLPEDFDEDVPSVEHMRKWALIRTGWRNTRTIACSSHAKAMKLAAWIRPLDDEGYSIVVVDGSTVHHMTAQTQAHRAMGKAAFQKSKDDVLGYWKERIAEHYRAKAEV